MVCFQSTTEALERAGVTVVEARDEYVPCRGVGTPDVSSRPVHTHLQILEHLFDRGTEASRGEAATVGPGRKALTFAEDKGEGWGYSPERGA